MDIDWSKLRDSDPDNQLNNKDAAPLARDNVFGTRDGRPATGVARKINDNGADEIYLYQFWRSWDEKNTKYVQFICRNPEKSTPDDPNVMRAVSFAQRWGYGGLCVTNLFAEIGQVWRGREEAVGPYNVSNIVGVASQAYFIICAWGDTFERGAGAMCVNMLRSYGHHRLFHLGLSSRGGPKHISQVSKTVVPILWV
jgi:hypothetical protein